MTLSAGPSELDAMCAIARAAALEAMAVYAGDIAAWSKPDQSPLTSADLRCDAVIRRQLEQNFPGVAILSEESAPGVSGEQDTFFLVDPLDGTKEFIRRNGEFTINIALVQGGQPVAGVVLAPALGDLFFGARGTGAWQEQAGVVSPIRVAHWAGERPLRVIGSRSHSGEALARWLARLPYPYEFSVAGSSLKFCRVAQGLADIYPRIGPTCQWDTAAGQGVLEAAGGAVLDVAGQPLAYGLLRATLNPDFIALADRTLQLPPLN